MGLFPADAARLIREMEPCRSYGKVTKVVGLIAEGQGIRAPLGSVCHLLPDAQSDQCVAAEVVGFRDGACLFMPYGDMRGIQPGSLIRNSSTPPVVPVAQAMLGRAVDAFGEPLDGKGAFAPETQVPLHNEPPNPLERPRIVEPLDVGVRSINGLLTLGKGQRVGIMAGSGVGKSTLMGMIARTTKADVNVIGLVGERGREVVEFMERDLGPEGMARSVLVVATSDKSPLIRMRAAHAATAIAEWFRDQGKDVLLMMDSVTRFCMAGREVGLAAGEPPTRGGYTPSVFAQLPQLLERAGKSAKGSITGIYTVLVDGDDFTEPIADATRSILDGHIVLTRALADQGHFPAIDVLKSISRLRSDITPKEALSAGRTVLGHMAAYQRVEDMVNIGAYQKGSNPEIDKAIAMRGPINQYLRQLVEEKEPLETSFIKLVELAQGQGPSAKPKQ
ncbi:flagellum-specific ATP synthase [Paucidesulfovibrio gracilis DSM 16080]|uniref:Flagellum-specific ATP synthase n=1 Tax=Paucidesulfovibrio gracilis DSM 16080 TaxID=1121449 RepID=A0A1T4XZW7_9BACT|nr:FliI/YscN family ATPase [Paucidesulfovibrio gracilis]SKA95124.1 flagellum-specific ATP synthase [Paucidesulfovibrio gracilis DSM 16080]